MLSMDIQTEDTFDFDMEKVARDVLTQALREENCPMDSEISLLLTGAEEIREMNRRFRAIDKETDVLSFPNVAFAAPADFRAAKENVADCCDPDTGRLFLGDIVLNTRRVRMQAAEYGHSVQREYAFLIAHSALHLCGYDHVTPGEAAVMEEKQEHILQTLGISRG